MLPAALSPVRKLVEFVVCRNGVGTLLHAVPFQCADTVAWPPVSPTAQTSFGAIAVIASANWMPTSVGGWTKLHAVPFQCSNSIAMKLVPSEKKPAAHRSFGPVPLIEVSSSEAPIP